jgi:uncharacterized protein YggU (UPF0235/DUF167 family)
MLSARLTPKASSDEVIGVEIFDGAPVLKARVRALPEGGRANAALEKLIARWLGVPPSSVKMSRGTKSRLKQISIEGDSAALATRIAASIAALGSG